MERRSGVPATLAGGIVVPSFLGERDVPWLRRLLECVDAHVGRSRRELKERLREGIEGAPASSLQLAAGVIALASSTLPRTRAKGERGLTPRAARRAAFLAMAHLGVRSAALAEAADGLGVRSEDVEAVLFADAPDERLVPPVPEDLGPSVLLSRSNLALVRVLLGKARRVTIRLRGNARAVVRLAKLRGLIAVVRRQEDPDGEEEIVLEVSGPLALFRHTTVYGRALGELLPTIAWCPRWRLEAPVVLPAGEGLLHLGRGDPIPAGREPRRFDSKLEAALARDLARLLPGWDVLREPEPVPSGGTLIFPDLALDERGGARRRVLIEVVGFWTPGYLERKLAQVQGSGLAGELVLCVDADKACAVEEALPAGSRVVPFRRRIRAEDVLEAAGLSAPLLQSPSPPSAPTTPREGEGGGDVRGGRAAVGAVAGGLAVTGADESLAATSIRPGTTVTASSSNPGRTNPAPKKPGRRSIRRTSGEEAECDSRTCDSPRS